LSGRDCAGRTPEGYDAGESTRIPPPPFQPAIWCPYVDFYPLLFPLMLFLFVLSLIRTRVSLPRFADRNWALLLFFIIVCIPSRKNTPPPSYADLRVFLLDSENGTVPLQVERLDLSRGTPPLIAASFPVKCWLPRQALASGPCSPEDRPKPAPVPFCLVQRLYSPWFLTDVSSLSVFSGRRPGSRSRSFNRPFPRFCCAMAFAPHWAIT